MSSFPIKHFELIEFACPCCGMGRISAKLVLHLDFIRRAWGGPVIVNSGFRCAKRNQEVGGAKNSRHLIGCAADITCTNREDKQRFEAFTALVSRMVGTAAEGWEVIIYPQKRFVHVAIPRQDYEPSFHDVPIDLGNIPSP